MRLLLLVLVSCAAPVLAQDGMTVTMTTDKTVYDYGEAIVITIDATNESGVEQTVWGSSSCRAMYRVDDFDVAARVICTADDSPVVYPPGASRRWVWDADPAYFPVPVVEGTMHTVTGYHLSLTDEEAVVVEAPPFVGGFLEVTFSAGLPPQALEPVRDSLNAEVVEHQEGNATVYERWRIEGTALEDAIDEYENDPRFFSFREIDSIPTPEGVFVTASEETPSGGRLQVEAGPNPFAGTLTVTVTPPRTEAVRVEVFDVQGRRMATLQDGVLAGQVPHQIVWQPSRLGNGTYLVQVSGTSFAQTRRVTFRR